DASALLFAAACRSLGLETRLLCSLHPIPLSLSLEAVAGKKATPKEPKGEPYQCLTYHLGKSSGAATPTTSTTAAASSPPPATVSVPYPLRIWAEVYSHFDEKWVPTSPIDGAVDNPGALEPPASANKQLQLSYVVAYDESKCVKDVTRRYSSQWGAKTSKLRLPDGEDGEDWWKRTLWLFSKSDTDPAEAQEDARLKAAEVKETMPTNLAGFNNHPLYALEAQLKKNEIIHPAGKEHAIGRFKTHLVYPRSAVKQLATREAWLKKGRALIPTEQPIKRVKARAVTIERKRRIEAEKIDAARGEEPEGGGGDASMSDLYAEFQTCDYVAPPIVDGKIPRNSFGNIELFHPNMLPAGAVHLPLNGIGRLAKKLGIEYATAVTGFEFARGNSTPVLSGIVVAEENAQILKEAHAENATHVGELERKKRETRVYGRWRHFIASLVTKSRVMERYAK
ncbi:Rad4 beta-hairpin domain 3-domain-containing protein, partial [Blyttiomyces helicus]